MMGMSNVQEMPPVAMADAMPAAENATNPTSSDSFGVGDELLKQVTTPTAVSTVSTSGLGQKSKLFVRCRDFL